MSSKKYINSKNWHSGYMVWEEGFLSKIHRGLIVNQLDFFNLVKN